MTYLIASLVVETGIPPREWLEMDPKMFQAIRDVFADQAKEREKIANRNKRFG